MGLQNSAAYMGASSFHNLVETDRKITEAMSHMRQWGMIPRVAMPGDFAVTPHGSLHSVLIGAGMAFMPPRGLAVGTYFAYSDGSDTIALHAAGATPFIDTVILRIADDQYGTVTGTKGARYDVIQGTPNASPVAVSDAAIDALGVPGTWMRLCDVRVNTADTANVPGGQFTTPASMSRISANPTCRIAQSSTQSVSNGSTQFVTMDTILHDTDGMGDVATNDWIIINTPGVYLMAGCLAFASNATGYRAGSILAGASGGGLVAGETFVPTINGQRTVVQPIGQARLAAGDVIRLRALQNSGGALNTDLADPAVWLSATWLCP